MPLEKHFEMTLEPPATEIVGNIDPKNIIGHKRRQFHQALSTNKTWEDPKTYKEAIEGPHREH